MKKESIVAILVGFGLGLTAALTILVLPQKISHFKLDIPFITQKDKVSVRVDQDSSVQTITPTLKKLVVDEPKDRLITQKSPLTVGGTAAPNSLVVLLTINNAAATTTDEEGKFEFKADLDEGRNDIQLTAYPKDKEPEVNSIVVYYIEE